MLVQPRSVDLHSGFNKKGTAKQIGETAELFGRSADLFGRSAEQFGRSAEQFGRSAERPNSSAERPNRSAEQVYFLGMRSSVLGCVCKRIDVS